ncbi:tumor necrosis factor receptor superfamily member 17 isoform X3 [Apodemus sylvaticus]|uniref:tumor necrosis factor receptor superfamily member 17 isoform X3 n=1 Tax=Apodemus sylvaticus TaxID=10129 RepID=UPI0022427712|nr:tumor necrosis factor receptor superfamily member 17 isoform X3 [Apodemus sylvaticus]
MAHRCFRSEYFDSLLHACKPCHLRCSNPPVPCQPYCDPSMASSVRETYTVLWIFLGLTLALSLALFTLSFLLRKMNPEMLKDKPQSPGQLDGSVSRTADFQASEVMLLSPTYPHFRAGVTDACCCTPFFGVGSEFKSSGLCNKSFVWFSR